MSEVVTRSAASAILRRVMTNPSDLNLGRVFPRIGQRFQSAPAKNLLELVLQRTVNQPIRSKGFAAVQLKQAAMEIGYAATGFLRDQNTRGCIPGIQIEFPEAV